MFEQRHLVPTLFFVDPWGYKGLSLRLINSLVKDWGSDGIIFFNYNRINLGLHNPIVEQHMNDLFGKDRVDQLRAELEGMTSLERESAIVKAICEAFEEMGAKYVLPFPFRNERGTRTSHHLVFITKHPRGYGIMKDIMAKQSSSCEQGVPSFEYDPATQRQLLLFELEQPLDNLADSLLDEFAGRS